MKRKQANESGIKFCVGYYRYSSDMQREESIEAQKRAVESYAEKNGLVLVDEFIDRAKTAKNDKRPNFQRMMVACEEGGFDIILVHKLDRFFRNSGESAIYRKKLSKFNIQLISVTQSFTERPKTFEGKLMTAITEIRDEEYIINLAAEVEKGKKENALKSMHVGGSPPYGFKLDRETMLLQINEKEADVVRQVFKRFLEGVGYGEIMEEINILGYKTRKGQAFVKSSFLSMLKNEKYAGTYIYNKSSSKDDDGRRNGHTYKPREEWVCVEGGCPALVSKEDFEKVQEKLATRMQTRQHSHAKETYLLTGRMVCGQCGGSFSGGRRERRKNGAHDGYFVSYACTNRSNSNGIKCSNKEISREYIEGFVIDELCNSVLSDKKVAELTKAYNQYLKDKQHGSSDELKTLRRRQKELQVTIDGVVDIIIESRSPTLMERLRQMEEDKIQLDLRVADAVKNQSRDSVSREEVECILAEIRTKLRSKLLCDIKEVLHTYVKQIIVYEDFIDVHFNFFPEINIYPNELSSSIICSDICTKTEGCEYSQPHEMANHRQLKTVGDSGGEGGI